MRRSFLLFIPLALLFSECQKKASVSLNAPTKKVDSIKEDSVAHIQGSFIPYTDTFLGTYREIDYNTDGYFGGPMFLDSPVYFYAVHPNANQIVIKCLSNVVRFLNDSITRHVNDTFVTNDNDYYLSGFSQSRNVPDRVIQLGVDTARIIGNRVETLYFNMAYSWTICTSKFDYFCSFVGVKK